MDEPEKNNKHNNLDEFLKKARTGQLEDDFEKEAAEGFALLGDEEARKLQAQTDRRVAPLFVSSRKKKAVQWSMAAGVVFLISLTVYFLKQGVNSEEIKVAQKSLSETKEVVAPPAPVLAPQAASVVEEKPGAQARGKQEASRAQEQDANSANNNLQDESPKETESNIVASSTEQPVQLAAAEKAPVTAPAPAIVSNAMPAMPNTGAAGPGETDKTAFSSRMRQNNEKSMKKSAAQEPVVHGERESKADYPDVSSELGKILEKKLAPSFKAPFSSLIIISEGVVKEIVFKDGDLSKNAKKEIERTLRELTAEDLRPAGLTAGEYKFDYRP